MQFVTSPLFESLPHLYHGFGMRSEEIPSGILFPKQVHGGHVEVFDTPVPLTWHEPADAVIVTCPSLPIGVKTADCLPILIAEGSGKGVAVVHAGWKGMALGILPKVLYRFVEHVGVEAEDVYLAVGPGIGACCLEVDEPVRAYFVEQGRQGDWEACVQPGRSGHWWLDLKLMAKEQAMAVGLKEGHIDVLPYCTRCEEAYFFSYRREGLAAGRQANYIVLKESEERQ